MNSFFKVHRKKITFQLKIYKKALEKLKQSNSFFTRSHQFIYYYIVGIYTFLYLEERKYNEINVFYKFIGYRRSAIYIFSVNRKDYILCHIEYIKV